MKTFQVKVPQLGEAVTEATLLQWKKGVGDFVTEDEILVEIETHKVVLECPAPHSGHLLQILKTDGASVTSDQAIAVIGEVLANADGKYAAPSLHAPKDWAAKNCMINQTACGRESGNPVCSKCGMDERVVYPGEADREAAQERAELRYLREHVKELEGRRPLTPLPEQSRLPRATGQMFQDAPWAPKMVVLPSGKFMMGSPDHDLNRQDYEGPQHEVTIAYQLAMGKHPVTFEEWDACVADGGTQYVPVDQGWGRGKRPVININWYDAQEYLAWLNNRLGLSVDDPTGYRLPSEAEWEYACRAGTSTTYWWGNDFQEERCLLKAGFFERNIKGNSYEHFRTFPVDCLGAQSMNAWGISGTHGNVEEWVQDCWSGNYEGHSTDGGAWTSETNFRVLRGGSGRGLSYVMRSAARKKSSPGVRNNRYGFRLARTVS